MPASAGAGGGHRPPLHKDLPGMGDKIELLQRCLLLHRQCLSDSVAADHDFGDLIGSNAPQPHRDDNSQAPQAAADRPQLVPGGNRPNAGPAGLPVVGGHSHLR
ncbi:MAG: hypothetical protein ACKVP0_27960 [Pirellulaceae bacterium]